MNACGDSRLRGLRSRKPIGFRQWVVHNDSKIFLKIMRKTDLQENVQKCGKDYFDVTITKCLWHTACAENGCEELCRLFCDVDDITYGGLKKIGFTRTKTLGYGGDCFDFHFFRKK